MMNDFNFNEIGIDKLILKSLNPVIVDLNKLISNKNVRIIKTINKRKYNVNGEEIEIGDIEIKDKYFFLRLSLKNSTLFEDNEYEKLEINPAKILFGHNVNNVNKADYINKAIEFLEIRLNEYGLRLEIKEAKIKEIELNTNIKLNESFVNYRQCMELIKFVLPNKYKDICTYGSDRLERYTGFDVRTKQISLKFYDKGIEQDMNLDYSILRIEYRLKSTNQVKLRFGYDDMKSLLDNLDDISIVFNSLIKKEIINPLNERVSQLVEYNYTRLIELKERDRYYIQSFCAKTQDDIIFDYEIVSAAIGRISMSKSNKSERRKSLRAELLQREKSGRNFFFGNIQRLNEIVYKLGYEKIEL